MPNKISLPVASALALRGWKTVSGRSSRSEWWYFYLFWLLSFVTTYFFGAMLMLISVNFFTIGISTVLLFSNFALFIPFISLSVRRLHDLNLSGWWLLVSFPFSLLPLVPTLIDEDHASYILLFVLSIILYFGACGYSLYLACSRGTVGENRFGAEPAGMVLDDKTRFFWSRIFSFLKSAPPATKDTPPASAASESIHMEAPNPSKSSTPNEAVGVVVNTVQNDQDATVGLLKRLSKMHADGILTDEEFSEQKKLILAAL
jgi:uncharacterized membrane protein YhaH (DUF805 family)